MNGTDRSNAIEFINTYPVGSSTSPSSVACRTVDNGNVTQTVVSIGQWVRSPGVYQIVARADEVRFYFNGKLLAVHNSNIPTEDLNIYFSTSDSGAGTVPVVVDHVSFSRSP